MKTPLRPFSHCRGLTLAEVLTVIVLAIILLAVFFPACPFVNRRAIMSSQASNGKTLFTAMVNYAGDDGDYPLYRDQKDPTTKVADSSEAFEILLRGGYLDDKKILFQTTSAWCKKAANTEATAKQVLPGENNWCYVAGLNRSTAKSAWPILANAFAPGTTHYVADISKKGGEWKGVRAVVVYCGGNAEVVDTLQEGDSYIVRRPDKVQQDAFVQDGDWLAGPDIKVLYPK
jgi:hypothetical protein